MELDLEDTIDGDGVLQSSRKSLNKNSGDIEANGDKGSSPDKKRG